LADACFETPRYAQKVDLLLCLGRQPDIIAIEECDKLGGRSSDDNDLLLRRYAK
jgi:hypothetical protein